MIVDFSFRKMQHNIVQVQKEKNCQPQTLYLVKLSFRHEGEIKTISDKGKLREFVYSSSSLKRWMKEILLTERK